MTSQERALETVIDLPKSVHPEGEVGGSRAHLAWNHCDVFTKAQGNLWFLSQGLKAESKPAALWGKHSSLQWDQKADASNDLLRMKLFASDNTEEKTGQAAHSSHVTYTETRAFQVITSYT